MLVRRISGTKNWTKEVLLACVRSTSYRVRRPRLEIEVTIIVEHPFYRDYPATATHRRGTRSVRYDDEAEILTYRTMNNCDQYLVAKNEHKSNDNNSSSNNSSELYTVNSNYE